MTIRIVDFDGNNFSDMESFYDEVTKVFSPVSGLNGRNMDALQDLLYGGMGLHDFQENIKVHWINSEKSLKDFGDTQLKYIADAFTQVPNIQLIMD